MWLVEKIQHPSVLESNSDVTGCDFPVIFPESSMPFPLRGYFLLALALAPILTFLRRRSRRSVRLPRQNERILIIGASSGVGHTLALQYSKLGVKGVCVVGRRADKIAQVVAECNAVKGPNTEILGITGDFADVDDMVRTRSQLEAGTYLIVRIYSRI
jgi:threonine synthase